MTTDDTVTAKLAEWEALVEGATPGPWAVEENDYGEHAVYQDEGDSAFGTAYIAEDIRQGHDEGRADAEFIAAARTVMPALLAAVNDVLRVCDERRGDCGDDYADGWTAGWADALLEVRRAVTKRIGGA